MQLDAVCNIQAGELRAAEIQIRQIGTTGEIQFLVAKVLKLQRFQSDAAGEIQIQIGAVVYRNLCQFLVIREIQLSHTIGNQSTVQGGKIVAAEIQFGNTS